MEEITTIGLDVAKKAGRELRDAMAVAPSCHALVDLGRQHDIGRKLSQCVADRLKMGQPLHVPACHSERAACGRALRRIFVGRRWWPSAKVYARPAGMPRIAYR